MTLNEKLTRIRRIGQDIATLQAESKQLRMELANSGLSPSNEDPRVSFVYMSGGPFVCNVARITECRVDDDDKTSKLTDVTVTFNPCEYAP